MGWTPLDVDRCSLWQFHSAYAGWAEANGADVTAELTPAEIDAAVAAFDAAPERIT
jgi:hypothetical protein